MKNELVSSSDDHSESNRRIDPYEEKNESEPEEEGAVYLICNPHGRLGFTVVSPDDPLGFKNPVEAVSELGQMRQDIGAHLKLYQAVPIQRPLIAAADLTDYNQSIDIEDFDHDLVKEHLI